MCSSTSFIDRLHSSKLFCIPNVLHKRFGNFARTAQGRLDSCWAGAILPRLQSCPITYVTFLIVRKLTRSTAALLVQLLFAVSVFAQQTQYIYDPFGRLIGVIDQDGRITIYDYDPAGNLLGIRRPEATTPVTITLVNPSSGVVGTVVEILGVGFASIPPRTISRSMACRPSSRPPARIVSSPTSQRARPPVQSRSQPRFGSATSRDPFRVPGITVQPSETTVAVGRQRRFTAIVAETMDQRVVWSVNGFPGGQRHNRNDRRRWNLQGAG